MKVYHVFGMTNDKRDTPHHLFVANCWDDVMKALTSELTGVKVLGQTLSEIMGRPDGPNDPPCYPMPEDIAQFSWHIPQFAFEARWSVQHLTTITLSSPYCQLVIYQVASHSTLPYPVSKHIDVIFKLYTQKPTLHIPNQTLDVLRIPYILFVLYEQIKLSIH